jgi:uncharacterized protein (DUF2336 family)
VSLAVQTRIADEATLQPRTGLDDLLSLTRSRSLDDRQRLLLGVASLCEAAPAGAQVSGVLAEIFLALAGQAEREIRQVLADRIAAADWAPPALVNMLALDEIEIARPIIAASPLLKDQDLLRILVEATIEHQIEIARRPNLSGCVADAIIDQGEPAPLTALAANVSAEISDEGLRRLVDCSRRIAGLRAPLSRHPKLSDTLARQLYQWVGEALQQAISERFRVDPAALGVAVDQAVVQASTWRPAALAPTGPGESERQEMERRLIDKLHGAGQLRPGFLIRAVRERRLSLFEQALAALGGFPVAQVRTAVLGPTPEPLFLACAAVGVDRAVFTAMLADIRKLTRGLPGDGAWSSDASSPEAAARAFRDQMAV